MSIISRYEVSLWAYNFAKEYYEKCRMYSELCDKATNVQEKSGHVLNETQMSMACLIFSQICLEAYINSFAGEKLPKLVWEKLEGIKFQTKWLVFPKIALGNTFDAKTEPYKSLQWLVDQRNFIVHYKGKFSKLEMIKRLGAMSDRIFNQFTVKEAKKAFELIQNLIKGLHRLDNSKIPDWLV